MNQIITHDNGVRQRLDEEITAITNAALMQSFRAAEHRKKLAQTLDRLSVLRRARRALYRGEKGEVQHG